MKSEILIEDGKSVVKIYDEVDLFFRMNDERDYTAFLSVDGTPYYFRAVGTDCPCASVDLRLYENTNKGTKFSFTITFDKVYEIKLLDRIQQCQRE